MTVKPFTKARMGNSDRMRRSCDLRLRCRLVLYGVLNRDLYLLMKISDYNRRHFDKATTTGSVRRDALRDSNVVEPLNQ